MRYWEEHVWRDIPAAPCVTKHADGIVDLHAAGFNFDHGHGFSLSFTREHLPILRKLVAELEEGHDPDVEVKDSDFEQKPATEAPEPTL